MQVPPTPGPPPARPPRTWARIFGYGLALWLVTVLVTFVTGSTNLLPTIVLLGSFLVPVTFVAWTHERARGDNVTVELLFSAFVVGGVLGILGASLLENALLRPSPAMFIGVGVIEEGVKVAALVFVARNMTHRTAHDGLVLGATVGFGFPAFESAGYALNALIAERDANLVALVETELLRGLVTPLGHGLWTTIVGGVLFAASHRQRWRVTLGVVATFVGVSLLHALWNSAHGIAVRTTVLLAGNPGQGHLLRAGQLTQLTPAQAHMITLVEWVALAVVAAMGVLWVVLLWRRAPMNGHPPVPGGHTAPDDGQGPDQTETPPDPRA